MEVQRLYWRTYIEYLVQIYGVQEFPIPDWMNDTRTQSSASSFLRTERIIMKLNPLLDKIYSLSTYYDCRQAQTHYGARRPHRFFTTSLAIIIGNHIYLPNVHRCLLLKTYASFMNE